MCGIFGLICQDNEHCNFQRKVKNLLLLSDSRGKEASGVAVLYDKKLEVFRQPIRSKELVNTYGFKKFLDNFSSKKGRIAAVGHSRLATNGLQTENTNNQPVVNKDSIIIHNGIVTNVSELWKTLRKKPKLEVDTEVIVEYLSWRIGLGDEIKNALSNLYKVIEGSASISYLNKYANNLYLATNTGSLFYSRFQENPDLNRDEFRFNRNELNSDMPSRKRTLSQREYTSSLGKPRPLGRGGCHFQNKDHNEFVYASERYILEKYKEKFYYDSKNIPEIIQLKPGDCLQVDLDTGFFSKYDLKDNKRKKMFKSNTKKSHYEIILHKIPFDSNKAFTLYVKKNGFKKIAKHHPDYGKIYRLRRCSKCILPSTMPFIEFDDDGICSYCKNHKPFKYKGIKELEKKIAPFRKKNR